MIRVLHVIDSLDLGGAQTALLNLLKYADRAHFHHEVAAMHGEGMFAGAFREIGVPVHSLSAKRWPPGYLRNLPKLIRRGNFDIAQFHLFGSNWIAKPVAAVCGMRRLYHHDQCNDAFRSENPLAIAVDRITNLLSTRILAVSRSIERFHLEVERIPANKVTYLPNSVDLEMFTPASASDRAAARRAFGIPEEAFVIAGVGRLNPQKNFSLLLGAAAPLLQSGDNRLLVLFGSGPEEALLRTQAAPLGERVRFAGTVADRASIYRAIDVLALTSRFEGLPMTMLEAMASGVPVVASDVDGMREVAQHEKHALLASPGDTAAFRLALERLAGDPNLRSRLANAALERVRNDFGAASLARELERLYAIDLGE